MCHLPAPPTLIVKVVSCCAYLLAGIMENFPVDNEGMPKSLRWQELYRICGNSSNFLSKLVKVLELISEQKIKEKNMDAIRTLLNEPEVKNIIHVSLAGYQIYEYLKIVIPYYDLYRKIAKKEQEYTEILRNLTHEDKN